MISSGHKRRPTYTKWTTVDLGNGRFNVVKGAPGKYVHAASAQEPLMSHRLAEMLNELDDLRRWRDAAGDRIAEHKREVERRDELLAGADTDLKAERAKTAALRALLEQCGEYLAVLLDRIRMARGEP